MPKQAKTKTTSIIPIIEFVSLERHASKVYMRNIFTKVRKQIQKQDLYYKIDVVHSYETLKYFLRKYDRPELTWTVELTKNSRLMECLCMKLESKGLPCSHMFRSMAMEHMLLIPSLCILKRRTRSDGDRRNTIGKISETVSEIARFVIRGGGKPIPWDNNVGSQADYIKSMLGWEPNLGPGGMSDLVNRIENVVDEDLDHIEMERLVRYVGGHRRA
ncbi:hypothetical protein M9H77_35768 [Catharanthus roseus]|uniref:Uncharacterized protein n=1 Tax=Catharanthus roseus TaxID=4058 RepID=A0ACB9ZRU7_CATRO|nr:hypothetical protein M9H77_35768 [Catharanthus roseus]